MFRTIFRSVRPQPWGKVTITLAVLLGISIPAGAIAASLPSAIQQQLSQLEQRTQGRLGVVLIDTADHTRITYRADERFPFCSTVKVMIVANILKESESNQYFLDRTVEINKADLSNHHPVTGKRVGDRMTLRELSAATLQYSDNTAANKLIDQLGGPQAVTHFSRTLGDTAFRLDRKEPDLNSAIPADERDTTTPVAMAESLRKLTLGEALQATQRQQLVAWMKGRLIGEKGIRAGVPDSWVVADRTGSGRYGTTNNIAVLWPPHRPPLVLVIYFTQKMPNAAERPDVIEETTRIATQGLRR